MTRVFLVEDDPTTQLILSTQLQLGGYEVSAFDRTDSAIDALPVEKPRGLVLDYQLPDGTAEDVIRALGAEIREVPVIVVTGYDNPRLRDRLFELGIRAFLHKDPELAFIEKLCPEVDRMLAAVSPDRGVPG